MAYSIHFPTKTLETMKKLGLKESDVEHAFGHGQDLGNGKVVMKYKGYEIGMFYIQDRGQYIITYVWTRERL